MKAPSGKSLEHSNREPDGRYSCGPNDLRTVFSGTQTRRVRVPPSTVGASAKWPPPNGSHYIRCRPHRTHRAEQGTLGPLQPLCGLTWSTQLPRWFPPCCAGAAGGVPTSSTLVNSAHQSGSMTLHSSCNRTTVRKSVIYNSMFYKLAYF